MKGEEFLSEAERRFFHRPLALTAHAGLEHIAREEEAKRAKHEALRAAVIAFCDMHGAEEVFSIVSDLVADALYGDDA